MIWILVLFGRSLFAVKCLPSRIAEDFIWTFFKNENVSCMCATMQSCAAWSCPAVVQKAFTTSVSWKCCCCCEPSKAACHVRHTSWHRWVHEIAQGHDTTWKDADSLGNCKVFTSGAKRSLGKGSAEQKLLCGWLVYVGSQLIVLPVGAESHRLKWVLRIQQVASWTGTINNP